MSILITYRIIEKHLNIILFTLVIGHINDLGHFDFYNTIFFYNNFYTLSFNSSFADTYNSGSVYTKFYV